MQIIDAGGPEVLGDELLQDVVGLHVQTFDEGVLAQLGRRFVADYYRRIAGNGDGFLAVATRGGKVAGYLSGTTQRGSFQSFRATPGVKWTILWRVATLRLSPMALLRAVRKTRRSAGIDEQAELLSVVVSPAARGQGLGRQLMQRWQSHLRERGLPSFVVYTDNDEGYAFYTRLGGTCLFHFRLGGRTSACFQFHLH